MKKACQCRGGLRRLSRMPFRFLYEVILLLVWSYTWRLSCQTILSRATEPVNFNGSGFYSGARFLKLLSSGAGYFPFMTPTPAPFDLNFAGSGSAPTKICYKSLTFVYRKSISIIAKPKKLGF